MLNIIRKQSKLNKILILIVTLILMLMIGLVTIYFIFLNKKTVEIDDKPKTIVPKYSVGENYLEKPGTGAATAETPPQADGTPPSPLPAPPSAPNKSYESNIVPFPVAPPTSQ